MTFWKKLFIGFIVLSLSAFCSAPVLGQPLYPLLERLVLEHDLIEAGQSREKAAQSELRQARAERYPHLEGLASLGREHIDFPDDRSSTSETRHLQSLRASQLLFDFGKSGADIDRTRAGVDLAGHRLIYTRQDLILQGISAYLNVYSHWERVRLARESEQRITELTGLEETLVDRQVGLATDVLQAKSQLAGAKSIRVQAEGQLANARNRFQAVFGFDLTDEQIENMLRPERPVEHLPVALDRALDIAVENSVDLHMAERGIEITSHELRFRQSAYYPDLHLVGEVKHRRNDVGVRGSRKEALGMVELTWDIFSGGRKMAAVDETRHNMKALEKEKDDLERMVQERVKVAWENLLTARENARYLKDQADILQEFLELAKRERRMGTRSLLDVLSGEINYLNALSNSIAADIDQDLAIYNMLFAMGLLELDALR